MKIEYSEKQTMGATFTITNPLPKVREFFVDAFNRTPQLEFGFNRYAVMRCDSTSPIIGDPFMTICLCPHPANSCLITPEEFEFFMREITAPKVPQSASQS